MPKIFSRLNSQQRRQIKYYYLTYISLQNSYKNIVRVVKKVRYSLQYKNFNKRQKDRVYLSNILYMARQLGSSCCYILITKMCLIRYQHSVLSCSNSYRYHETRQTLKTSLNTKQNNSCCFSFQLCLKIEKENGVCLRWIKL